MLKNEIYTPVLLMIFNRPEKTSQMFEVIRAVKPKKLYIHCDGPRIGNKDDFQLVLETRQIVEDIDWPCDVHRLYQKKNLGCSLSGKTAWDWIFENEDRMIMIEDDAVVSYSFFPYCQELLEKYKDDERIAFIGGVNYGVKYGSYTYYFNKAPAATYSMATWRRVYNLYEYRIDTYKKIRNTKEFIDNFDNKYIYYFYRKMFDNFVKNGGNTYDIQMIYLTYKYNMLSIIPNINLSSNIGLDYGGANNNINPNSRLALRFGNRPRFEIDQIIHPPTVEYNKKIDLKNFEARALKGDKIFIYILKSILFNLVYYPYKYIKNILK